MRARKIVEKIAVTAVFAAGILTMWQVEERQEEVQARKAAGAKAQVKQMQEEKPQEKQEEKQAKATSPAISPKLMPYVLKNQDVIGYIEIPDTNVDYPVLMGEDNQYYLSHDIDGNEEKAGCIMADHNYQGSDIREQFLRHTLIYGHYLKSKKMFTSVAKYKDEEFFKKHPYLYFGNLKETGKWKVFSVYVLNADKETIPRTFDDDKEYISFLKKIKARSWYSADDVALTKDSKILTLCTCSYETKNSRAIVHAVLVDE